VSQSALAAAGIDRAGAGLIDMQYVGYGIKLSRRIQSSIWMIFLVSKGIAAKKIQISVYVSSRVGRGAGAVYACDQRIHSLAG
jgi:hypothetical protein